MTETASPDFSSDLSAWMPRLIAVFRATQRRGHRIAPGGADELSTDELAVVARGVRRLSEGLTGNRRFVGARYLDDPELLAAYLLYYWPISYVQGRQVLAEVGARPRAVLDLGSGPGPLALAAYDSGAAEVIAADRSADALKLAEKVAASAGRVLVTRTWDALGVEQPGAGQAFSMITMSHTLNELWAGAPDRIERRTALCRTLLGRLRKGGSLVLIEPALQVTTRELLAVRDSLVAGGSVIRAPCLYRGACPALIKPDDWCHAERAWNPAPALAQIIEAAGLHKEALKMAYLVVGAPGSAWPVVAAERPFRVVSERLASRSRLRVLGCGPEGRIPLSLGDSAHAPGNVDFLRAQRGDVLDIVGAEPSAEGPGIRIVPATTVRIAVKAGRPIG